jgi:cyclic pyranopterin phosphate synthase
MTKGMRIDSHKLMLHPQRVAQWLDGENIYPLYVEVAPTGACNHRCIFCALDYVGYVPTMLDTGVFLKNLPIMAQRGVKSMMVAGEGEPLLNKDTPLFIKAAKELGIDVAMTSNGVLFTEDVIKETLPLFSWVRFSVNAGTTASYDRIHRGKAGDFEKVLTNIGRAVEYKKAHGLTTTIGVQMLLIPENQNEVLNLAERVAEAGVDYFSIKPFSKHPSSICNLSEEFDYETFLKLEKDLFERFSAQMQIAFRTQAMEKLKFERSYDFCRGLPFWAYIDSRAQVWACSAHLGKPEFCYGDMHEQSFDQIWEGPRRKQVLAMVEREMDVKDCREICRLDEINIYLHELKNPGPHVNFI